jgi:hypothetical protein
MTNSQMALACFGVAALFAVAALTSGGSTRTFAAIAAFTWICAAVAWLP